MEHHVNVGQQLNKIEHFTDFSSNCKYRNLFKFIVQQIKQNQYSFFYLYLLYFWKIFTDFLSISISFGSIVPLLLHVFSYQFRAVFPFEIELCHDRPTGVRNCCYCCHITSGAIVKTIHVTCPLRSASAWLLFLLHSPSLSLLSLLFISFSSRSTHAMAFLCFFLLLCNFISYIRQSRCRGDICQQLGCWPKSQASI